MSKRTEGHPSESGGFRAHRVGYVRIMISPTQRLLHFCPDLAQSPGTVEECKYYAFRSPFFRFQSSSQFRFWGFLFFIPFLVSAHLVLAASQSDLSRTFHSHSF